LETSNSIGFWDFLKRYIVGWPRNPQRTVVLMDNASWHVGNATWYDDGVGPNRKKLREESIPGVLTDAGINVMYQPPYSSELNPM